MARSSLPHSEVALLQDLHKTNMPCLRSRTRQLRDAGWTLSAIGEPLGAPRSTVRSWENHPDARKPFVEGPCANQATNLTPPNPPGIRPAPFISETDADRPKVRSLAIDVPEHDQERIAHLAPLARRVRGGTPKDSPYREARQELNDLLLAYYERKVPVQRLADLAGVTYRAMKVRLDEHSKASHIHAVAV